MPPDAARPSATGPRSFPVEVAGGGRTRAVRVAAEVDLDWVAADLAVPTGPVALLIGGASGLDGDGQARVQRFFRDTFVPAIAATGATVLDGGTDAGVMRLIGAERERSGGSWRLIGVAPFAKVRVPGSPGVTALARGHSDVILVPGDAWGDESRWFHLIAERLAPDRTVTVLVNGGPIALDEIEQSIDRGGRVLVVDGSGRAADDIGAAMGERADTGSRPARLAASAAVEIVSIDIETADLARRLDHTSGRTR